MIGGAVGVTFASMAAIAWTGPTQSPPSGNVSAPINVGTIDQVKNAGLSVNALAVFGNSQLGTASGGVVGIGAANSSGAKLEVTGAVRGVHITSSAENGLVSYGPSSGSGFYGVLGQSGSYYGALGRADGYSFVGSGALYNAGSIRSTTGGYYFPDGTVQVTAAGAGGVSNYTHASCVNSGPFTSCIATCPAGWYRSGCSGGCVPSGNGCSCTGSGNHYAYCVR